MSRLFALGFMLVACATAAAAGGYPTRPITIVVPTTAGGPPDTIARLLSEPMRASLGQPIIIENVTGAGGTLAINRVVRAEPDGYTLSIGHLNSHVFGPASYPLSFDLLQALEPVALLTSAPLVLVARSTLPPANVQELIAWLKHNPDKISMGGVGMGGPGRVWSAYFQKATGTRFQYVPYRGAAAYIPDLMAGQIDLATTEGSNILPHLRGGKIKTYAVLTETRWAAAPEIPTMEEAGGPVLHMQFWHGLWAPRGTPADIVAQLSAATMNALADANVKARLADLGQEEFLPEQQTAAALAAFHRSEIERWWPIIAAAGIKDQ